MRISSTLRSVRSSSQSISNIDKQEPTSDRESITDTTGLSRRSLGWVASDERMGRRVSRKVGRVSRHGKTDAAADLRCDGPRPQGPPLDLAAGRRVPGRAHRPPVSGLGDQVGVEPGQPFGVAREDDRGVPALRDGELVEVDGTRDDHLLPGIGEEVPPRDGGDSRRGVSYRRSASRSIPTSTARSVRSSSRSIRSSAKARLSG